ncbi:MAG: hypothetical protein PHT54_01235 [Candidatus Nanoarchaeia archaeon]|nr:hypothetical protein [Candidatus Nanoarchaeia archaeon]
MNTEKIKQNSKGLVEALYKRDELIRNKKKTDKTDKQILELCDSIESSL